MKLKQINLKWWAIILLLLVPCMLDNGLPRAIPFPLLIAYVIQPILFNYNVMPTFQFDAIYAFDGHPYGQDFLFDLNLLVYQGAISVYLFYTSILLIASVVIALIFFCTKSRKLERVATWTLIVNLLLQSYPMWLYLIGSVRVFGQENVNTLSMINTIIYLYPYLIAYVGFFGYCIYELIKKVIHKTKAK